jgi:hypothetical protein
MSRITKFYEKLPRGQVTAETSSNPLDKYRINHFGDKPSPWREYSSGKLEILFRTLIF